MGVKRGRQSKLDPKSQKMMFVGFVDGSRAIKYYNSRTRHVGITRNYHFVITPPDQFEGEDPTGDQIETVESLGNLKQ